MSTSSMWRSILILGATIRTRVHLKDIMYDCCKCSRQNLTTSIRCVYCHHDSGGDDDFEFDSYREPGSISLREHPCSCKFYGIFPFEGSESSAKQRLAELTLTYLEPCKEPRAIRTGRYHVVNDEVFDHGTPDANVENKFSHFITKYDWGALMEADAKAKPVESTALVECEALFALYRIETQAAAALQKRTRQLLRQLHRQIHGRRSFMENCKIIKMRRLFRVFVILRRLKPRKRWPVRFWHAKRSRRRHCVRDMKSANDYKPVRVTAGEIVDVELVEDIWTDFRLASLWLQGHQPP